MELRLRKIICIVILLHVFRCSGEAKKKKRKESLNNYVICNNLCNKADKNITVSIRKDGSAKVIENSKIIDKLNKEKVKHIIKQVYWKGHEEINSKSNHGYKSNSTAEEKTRKKKKQFINNDQFGNNNNNNNNNQPNLNQNYPYGGNNQNDQFNNQNNQFDDQNNQYSNGYNQFNNQNDQFNNGYNQYNQNGQFDDQTGLVNPGNTAQPGQPPDEIVQPPDELGPPPEPPPVYDELPSDENLSPMDIIQKANHIIGPESVQKMTTTTQDGVVQDENGEQLFEGDIIITPNSQRTVEEMKKVINEDNTLNDAIVRGRWPGARIPFTLSGSFSSRDRSFINAAINDYKKYTCLKFVPRDSRRDRNYVYFVKQGGCSSMIGMQGGAQKLTLGRGCINKGVIIHEMMHAAGFYHEQSRQDRDAHISIQWGNIWPNMKYNFQKYRPGVATDLHQPYDTDSVMHYGSYAFSSNGRQTIKARSGRRLGQRAGLSSIDRIQLNLYYGCEKGPGPKPLLPDNFKFCKVLGSYCKSEEWVKTNCKNTCCKDNHRKCPVWAKAGYCDKSYYKKYMLKNCARSCRTC